MKHTRILPLILILAVVLTAAVAIPLAAQAAEVAWNSECLAFQSGYHDHDWRLQSTDPANCLHGTIRYYKCKNCGNTCTVNDGVLGDHKFPDTWDRQKDPTCTEPGTDIHFCTVCKNASETRPVAALGHIWDSGTVTKEPTCTAAGEKTYHCTRMLPKGKCTGTKTEPVPALGHSMGEWKTVKAATCTAEGSQERVCTRCGGAKETKAIPALGHKPQAIPGVAATCTAPGKTEGSKCSVCGATIKAQTEIPALGHNWGAWKEFVPGSCIKKQVLVKTCSRCGAEEYWTKDYGDHDWGEWTTVKEPTATEDGLKERVCKNDASHKEQAVIPATGVTPKPELTVTLLTKNSVSYTPQTEFEENEIVWVTVIVTNTGNVDLEVWDYDKYISTGFHEYKYGWGSIVKPGESYQGDYVWFITDERAFTAADVIPGTETEDLYGKVTYTITVPCYKPGTKEVLCTGTGTASIGILKNKDLHPALLLEATWDPDAGEGKRVVGATVPVYDKVTNIGNCPVYVYTKNYLQCSDFVFPSESTYVEALGKTVYVVNPGEYWTLTYNETVKSKEVETGILNIDDVDGAYYIDTDGKSGFVYSNVVPISIPLTYPDGTTPEEEKPALKLTVVPTKPEKEAYTNTDQDVPENYVCYLVTYTNTGNVPLRVDFYRYRGAGFTDEYHKVFSGGTVFGGILNPGETFEGFCLGFNLTNKFLVADPEDSPYAGNYPLRFKGYGYAADDKGLTTPICESNAVDFNYKFAKPGPAGWEIPEESQMKVDISTNSHPSYVPSDPAGYQLDEYWSAYIIVSNPGPVDAIQPVLHIDKNTYNTQYTVNYYARSGSNWVEYELENFAPDASYTVKFYGQIAEDDVQRGYIEMSAYVTWTDPDSGKEKKAYSNVWNIPVISKTGLLLKKDYNTPANGEYFEVGEPINWTLTATNTSKEPITNVTVTDKGATVGTSAEIAAGETLNCTVPSYTVTEYDAVVVGHVTNYAMAVGTDLLGVERTYPSNTATAPTKKVIPPIEPGGGFDPLGPIHGVNPAVSIVKTDAGPANGSYYELDEEVTFYITVTNTGDCELNNLKLYDSLAGFTPIDTLGTLAVSDSHTFTYKYTVTQPNVDHGFVVNSATLTYTFLGGIPGTPMPSNKCKVYCGELSDHEEGVPPFDPELLHGEGDDHCALTLEVMGDDTAQYTLHSCKTHAELARAAEDAVLNGDSASPIWRAEVNNLYETLYEAASDEAKADLLWEREQYFAYVDTLEALAGEEAAAEALRLKTAELCCMIHTFPETLPDSLTGVYAEMLGRITDTEGNSREIGALDGSDAPVTETYAGPAARALKDVRSLLNAAKAYDAENVFQRGQILWQASLDEIVNPAYLAADKDQRKLIAAWRITLDSLLNAERPFLEDLYSENPAMVEEVLMKLYRVSALEECVQ